MDWRSYWSILRRRWALVAIVVALDLVVSGYLFLRSYRHLGYEACTTLYVADVSAPSTTLETTDQLLAGETAANFFADDILDVAQSGVVASYVSRRLAGHHLPSSAEGDISGAVSGSRRDRTLGLCVSNPSSATAVAASQQLGRAMSIDRGRFIGAKMAKRTFVRVISPPSVSRVSGRSQLQNFGLRVFLGLLVAVGLALVWDALDPRVRDARDVEQALHVPVLTGR